MDEKELLTNFKAVLGRQRSLTAQQFGARAELLPGLVASGLLAIVQKKGIDTFKLTDAGKAALKPAKAARAKRPPKPRPLTIEDLDALEARLAARLDALAARLSGTVRQAEEVPAGAHPLPAGGEHARKTGAEGARASGNEEHAGVQGLGVNLEATIPEAIREADRAGRHGGLVPIPEVRKLVLARGAATRAQFDQVLLELERGFHIDLKIANDPRRADAAEGIQVPGRGLVYFALAR